MELQTEDYIENFHLSPRGNYIGFVTYFKIRVLRLDLSDPGAPKLTRVELTPKPKKVPHLLHFYQHNSSDFLLTATLGLGLVCYKLSADECSATPVFR